MTIARGLYKERETTDRYGKVMWIPDDRGTHNIRASKEGYLPSGINIIYISTGAVNISNVVVNPSYNSATFTWKTDKTASCKLTVDGVLRGVSPSGTSHRDEALLLRSGTAYTFAIEVVDGEGRYEGTFTTESHFDEGNGEEVRISDVDVDVTHHTATFRWETDKPVRCKLTVDGLLRGCLKSTKLL